VALKVSDEFTVPLCAIHHTENHATGDERGWWRGRNIDPLPIAEELWRKGREPITIRSEPQSVEIPKSNGLKHE
jgi:hypothetical protein